MKKQLFNLKTLLCAVAISFSGAANAFTAVASGNWSSPGTWGGIAPSGNVLNNNIIIPAGVNVVLDVDVTFSGLLSTFSVTGVLTNSTNNKLTLNQGAFVGNGTVSIHKIVFAGLNASAFTGVLTVDEMVTTSSTALIASANIADSLMLEGGTLTINAGGNVAILAGSTIKVGNGLVNIAGGILNTSSNYNLLYVGSSKTAGLEFSAATVQNVSLKMANSSQSVTLNNNTTINGDINLMVGQLDFKSRMLTAKGGIYTSPTGIFFSNSTSDLIVDGPSTAPVDLRFTSSTLANLTIDRTTTVKLHSLLSIFSTVTLMKGVLSFEAGSGVTMNANSKIYVIEGSMVTNAGNLIGVAPYDVEYKGSSNTSTGVETTGGGLRDVNVNMSTSTAKTMLTNNVSATGTLQLSSGHMDLNGKNFTVNGAFTQTATATIIGNTTSELVLNIATATASTLYFDNANTTNQTLSKLKLNITDGSALMLGSTLYIKDELMFSSGKLKLDNADLMIQSTGTITGYSDSKYVMTTGTGSGRLGLNVVSGGNFVTFPIGTDLNYSPAYIQQTSSATTGNIMIKAMNDVLTAGYVGFPLNTSSAVSRTWFIDAESGATINMNMKLGWTAAAEVNGFNRNSAMIRHFTSGTWDTNSAQAANAGAFGTFELSRNGITSLSPFAVADQSSTLKVAELSNNMEFSLFPNPATDIITLKMPSASNVYQYEIVDVTGRHVTTTEMRGTAAQLNVSGLQPGVYFVKTTDLNNNTFAVKRFVKD